jgi:hypothetical protein
MLAHTGRSRFGGAGVPMERTSLSFRKQLVGNSLALDLRSSLDCSEETDRIAFQVDGRWAGRKKGRLGRTPRGGHHHGASPAFRAGFSKGRRLLTPSAT